MSNSQSKLLCAICLEETDVSSSSCSIVSTPCSHQFHIQCCLQAVLQNPTCPLCRTDIPDNWLFIQKILPIRHLRRYLQTTTHRARYWENVEKRLAEPPMIGPMLPSHQRWYNMDILGETATRPFPWSPVWIQDRLVEMRIRFNIPSEIVIDERDIVRCENLGLRGILPEWTPVRDWHF